MNYMIIEGGKVVNIAVATADVAAERGWIACPEGVDIGWIFDGSGQPLPPPPDTEGEATRVRTKRNTLLVESDVMVLPDRWAVMTSEQQAEWAIYRQALRDISNQDGFPWSINWPTIP